MHNYLLPFILPPEEIPHQLAVKAGKTGDIIISLDGTVASLSVEQAEQVVAGLLAVIQKIRGEKK